MQMHSRIREISANADTWQPGFPLSKEGWEVARRAERRHADALGLLEIKLNEGLLEG